MNYEDLIRIRCSRTEDGCLHWNSDAKSDIRRRHPAAVFDGKYMLVRRALYELATGKELPADRYLRPHCGNEECVEPKHQRLLTQQTKNKIGGLKAGETMNAGRKAKMQATRRARGLNRLTEDQVREIKQSDESNDELAARLGCHRDSVLLVRKQRIHRDYSNPFAGLGA